MEENGLASLSQQKEIRTSQYRRSSNGQSIQHWTAGITFFFFFFVVSIYIISLEKCTKLSTSVLIITIMCVAPPSATDNEACYTNAQPHGVYD